MQLNGMEYTKRPIPPTAWGQMAGNLSKYINISQLVAIVCKDSLWLPSSLSFCTVYLYVTEMEYSCITHVLNLPWYSFIWLILTKNETHKKCRRGIQNERNFFQIVT